MLRGVQGGGRTSTALETAQQQTTRTALLPLAVVEVGVGRNQRCVLQLTHHRYNGVPIAHARQKKC